MRCSGLVVAYKSDIWAAHEVNCYSNLVLRSQKHELEGTPLKKILKFDRCYEYDRNRFETFG